MGSILATAIVLAGLQGRDSAGVDSIRALRVAGGAQIDWAAAESIDDLRQREPRQGAPASERTGSRS